MTHLESSTQDANYPVALIKTLLALIKCSFRRLVTSAALIGQHGCSPNKYEYNWCGDCVRSTILQNIMSVVPSQMCPCSVTDSHCT